jgi:hypothetical protein
MLEESAITEIRDSRSAPRRPVLAEVQLRRSGSLNFVVEVHDLSERGCRTDFVERPRIGEILWIKFEGLSPLESTVRWAKGFEGGLEFAKPIDGRVLEDLFQRMETRGLSFRGPSALE